MAEYVNFSAEADDDDDEELEKKSSSKSEKKASIFGASVLKSSEASVNKEASKKAEGLDRLLAELSFAKKEQQAEASKAEQSAATQTPEAARNEQSLPEVSEELAVQDVEAVGEAEVEQVDEQLYLEALENTPEETEPVDSFVSAETSAEDDTAASTATPATPKPSSTSSGRPTSTSPTPAPTQTRSLSSRTVPMPSMPVPQQAAAHAGTVASPNTLSTSSTNPAAANVVGNTQQEVDDAEYYGRARGRREGVLAGLLLGGGIEHFRHKRRERKMEKDFSKKEKAHEKELENLTYEQKRQKMVKDLREAYEQRYKNSQENAPLAATPGRAEALSTTKVVANVEQGKVVSPAETIEVPPDHHIESSAWLNVEVDAHGNPVEDASFEYGAEYYRERAHEVRADDGSDDDSKPSHANTPDQKSQPAASTMFAGSSLTSTPPASVGQQKLPSTKTTLPTPKRVVRAVTSPPTTPVGTAIWSVILVVMLVAIAIVIW